MGITRGRAFRFLTRLRQAGHARCMTPLRHSDPGAPGRRVALLPIANPEPYHYWMALRGIWPRVQESLVYGVKSAMVGQLLGFTFTGRAGIFAPLELSPKKDGVLAEVESPHHEGLAVAALDLEVLRELRNAHPWRDTNEALYERYLPAVYQNLPQ